MTPQEIDEWAVEIREYAVARFTGEGAIPPHAMLLATVNPLDGKTLDPPLTAPVLHIGDFGDRDSKDGFAGSVRESAKQCKAIACVFISEVWANTARDDAERKELLRRYKQIADMPGRRECLMLTYCRRGRAADKAWFFEIKREGDSVSLGELTETDSAEGRMVGWLDQPN